MLKRLCNYFRLPNFLFDYKLSSTELAVASAMYSVYSNSKAQSHIVKIKQSTICELTNIKCLKTVSRALNTLEAMGIIKWKKRSKKDNTGKLGTYQYGLQSVGNRYTFINRKIFNKSLSASELRMYLFICKCIDNKRKMCWNSYNDISTKLSMARSRVIELIKQLVNKGLLITKKIKAHNGGYSDNHYILANLNEFVKIKKRKPTVFTAPLTFQNAFKNILVYYTKLEIYICQEQNKNFLRHFYFFIRGSPKKYYSTNRTHLLPTKKEISLYLTKIEVITIQLVEF